MRRVLWHLCGRWAEVRADRAFRRYLALRALAEKFFRKSRGGQ